MTVHRGDERPFVVITHRVHPEVVDLLAERCQVHTNDGDDSLPASELRAWAPHAHALMMFMPDRVDERFLTSCPRLQIIAGALKGFDNFDVDACTRRGIWLTHVDALLAEPTAELAVGLMLGLARHIRAGDERVRTHFPGWRPVLYGRSLIGASVGIIGAGQLGRALARLLTGFNAHVRFCDPGAAVDAAPAQVPLHELLATSEVVVVCAPLLPATVHLLDHAALALMPRGSLLINVGRGSVVDESAVADALARGHLAGYAADVFEFEDWARDDRPERVHPGLLEAPDKTLFTPHLGSAVSTCRQAIETRAARSILQALDGAVPDGAVNDPRERSAPAQPLAI